MVSLDSRRIKPDAITSEHVKDLEISLADIANESITNAKINPAAAIAYSKLNLAAAIMNADINAAAAIALTKLSNNLRFGLIDVDPPSIAANSSGAVTLSITGEVGHRIIMCPPNALEDGLLMQGAAFTAENTVTLRIRNTTADAIDGESRTWSYWAWSP